MDCYDAVALIGVISDMHGYGDPQTARYFQPLAHVERIIHAGDIGSEAVMTQRSALNFLLFGL